MPYITREDGVRFIIPSYRDTLVAKKESLLKREILLLSANYGEYITLQKKNTNQYEVAFSPDPGFLLGECIWQHFNRPDDMIYCEAIPNTSEAILVIVKAGSVYLDGSFAIDSIAEELVVFKTQKNNFDIYIYGDVPVSQELEDNKFTFDATSVRSFNVLTEPVFPTLEGVKAFQLQAVDTVLKAQGIGVVPIKKLVTVLAVLAVLYMAYNYITTHKEVATQIISIKTNPYQGYNDELSSPSPSNEIYALIEKIQALMSIPGWDAIAIDFVASPQGGDIRATLKSNGGRMNILNAWGQQYHWTIEILQGGVFASTSLTVDNRHAPATINSLQEVYAAMIDSLSYILPGSALRFNTVTEKGNYKETELDIVMDNASPTSLIAVADALKGLPLVMIKASMTINNGVISSSFKLKALGN
ncbi:MAG: hypothetical protein P4M14_09050 [Gammaproteobacteria bacterium]|nr:hypothetical protein [Gammaproteobacteria bacterium]